MARGWACRRAGGWTNGRVCSSGLRYQPRARPGWGMRRGGGGHGMGRGEVVRTGVVASLLWWSDRAAARCGPFCACVSELSLTVVCQRRQTVQRLVHTFSCACHVPPHEHPPQVEHLLLLRLVLFAFWLLLLPSWCARCCAAAAYVAHSAGGRDGGRGWLMMVEDKKEVSRSKSLLVTGSKLCYSHDYTHTLSSAAPNDEQVPHNHRKL
jgi:hypothetical protein